MKTTSDFDSIEEVIQDITAGRMVIVTDDADRENEGDLVMAAEKVTPEAINFMSIHGRGLICAPITEERARQLGLQRMVLDNRESQKTDFTVSVDAAKGITTGISAWDRARTIQLLADPKTTADELIQPGQTFEPKTYAGAGHGFMRAGEAPDASEANRNARAEAWDRWKALLQQL